MQNTNEMNTLRNTHSHPHTHSHKQQPTPTHTQRITSKQRVHSIHSHQNHPLHGSVSFLFAIQTKGPYAPLSHTHTHKYTRILLALSLPPHSLSHHLCTLHS